MEKFLEQLKVLLLCGLVVLVAQFINLRGDMNLGNSIIGMLIIVAVSLLSLKVKSMIPLKIPAFAWASLFALLLTTPWCPIQQYFLTVTKQISAGVIGTVILAVAGVSIGCKLDEIKKLSWKIVLVAFVVFIGTFFGSALISELILKAQGII